MEAAHKPSAVRVVFGIPLVIGALILLGFGVPGIVGASADRAMKPVAGEVVSVSSERRRLLTRGTSPNSPTHENLIRVRYRYVVDGKTYEGDVHALDEPRETITDDAKAKARIEALRSAEELTVLVHPADPERAVLARRQMAPAVAVSVVGAILFSIGLILLLGWRRDRRVYERLSSIANEGEDVAG